MTRRWNWISTCGKVATLLLFTAIALTSVVAMIALPLGLVALVIHALLRWL